MGIIKALKGLPIITKGDPKRLYELILSWEEEVTGQVGRWPIKKMAHQMSQCYLMSEGEEMVKLILYRKAGEWDFGFSSEIMKDNVGWEMVCTVLETNKKTLYELQYVMPETIRGRYGDMLMKAFEDGETFSG